MELESIEGGLIIQEGSTAFVLELPESASPLDELFILAAIGVVAKARDSDGKLRALEILTEGDDYAKGLAVRICAEFLPRRADV